VRDRARLVTALGAHLRTRPAADWIARLAAAGVPCGLVRGVREALADVATDPVTGVAPAAGGAIRRPPPTLDAHGALVRAHGWEAFRVMPPDR
jgi:crotonobetainyl-CoA:carnitine CoA-transferase CaiB-like acyl-CoA transferase